MISNKRLTWQDGRGNWGMRGVDLAAQPPAVYGALHKLKDMEHLVETITSPDASAYLAEEAMIELLGERSISHEHAGR